MRAGIAVGGLLVAAGCGSASLPWPLMKRTPKIGLVGNEIGWLSSPSRAAFLEGMRRAGYVEGQTVTIVDRSAEGQAARLPDFMAELVSLPVDVLVVASSDGVRAAKQATQTLPVVSPTMANPLGLGLIESLARPGGNVTGLTVDVVGNTLQVKRLSLLKELLPGLTQVGAIWSPTYAPSRLSVDTLQQIAPTIGLGLVEIDLGSSSASVASALAGVKDRGVEALLNVGGPFVDDHRAEILTLVGESGLPGDPSSS